MVLEETGKFATNVLDPLNEIGDTEGCTYVDQHTIKTPPGFKEAYDQYNEGGWQGLVRCCFHFVVPVMTSLCAELP